MKIKFGTNRLTILGKKYVYKIALHKRGYAANLQEYSLAFNNNIVAKSELHWYGLKQEKLSDIKIYDRYATLEDIQEEHKELFTCKLHNKLQVGKDSCGVWKIFDYEDIKYYTRKENLYDMAKNYN